MKAKKLLAMSCILAMLFTGCGTGEKPEETVQSGGQEQIPEKLQTLSVSENATKICLSDTGILVADSAITEDNTQAVYEAKDIVYYQEGKDFTYGDGTAEDAHSQEEADGHTVVHITQPGEYIISGKLSAGQIAVDLGKDAQEDPNAVVTLVLDNADITCTVAPAIIFYNVYECGGKEEATATMDVDTTAAGARVLIADGSANDIRGAYVAKIYKSVELSEDGTEIVDSKKLHKYDGAFYSKQSLNIYGGKKNDGILRIYAENEGLDSELHLTMYSGNIYIQSGNDGINTNEDNISVTRILGGNLSVEVNGATGEGDGIDSNGWLVIDGGKVYAYACSTSGDSGVDADKGVYVRGGELVATGNMFDRVESTLTHGVFTFEQRQSGGQVYTLQNEAGQEAFSVTPVNDFQYLVVFSSNITEGNYTLWRGETQLSGSKGTVQGGGPGAFGGMMPGNAQAPEIPEGMERPEMPEGGEFPEGMTPPEKPDGMQPQEGMQFPNGMGRPQGGNFQTTGEKTEVFVFAKGANYFTV